MSYSKSKENRAWLVSLLVVLIVVALDQLTKMVVLSRLEPGEIIPVVSGVFNLTLTFNRGAAFGLFSELEDPMRYLVLAAATVVALSAVVYFFLNDYRHDVPAQAALSMIIGGAIGNIIDRVRAGEVVDFLDFYFRHYHWPAFNVADSAICIGVFVLLFRKPEKAELSSEPVSGPL